MNLEEPIDFQKSTNLHSLPLGIRLIRLNVSEVSSETFTLVGTNSETRLLATFKLELKFTTPSYSQLDDLFTLAVGHSALQWPALPQLKQFPGREVETLLDVAAETWRFWITGIGFLI